MAIITRTITNNLTTNLDLFVPGYNTIKPLVSIAPSATVDLFTVITGDELEAIQNQLIPLVASGSITVNATVDTATFNPVGGGGSGVTSIHADSGSAITGAVQLVSGTGVSLSEGAGSITVNATPAGITEQIQFNNAGAFGVDDNINWDSTHHRLGIGTGSPATAIDIEFSSSAAGSVVGSINNGTSTGDAVWQVLNNSDHAGQFGIGGSAFGGILQDATFVFNSNGVGGLVLVANVGDVQICASGITPQLAVSTTGSAIVAITSTTQGFLPPVMTTTQKDAISTPASGLVVYDSTLNKLSVWTGSAWQTVTSV